VFNKQVSVFAGSTSGACSPYVADELDLAYPPGPPGDNTPDFLDELYFIIPVSAGGGLIFLAAVGTLIYCALAPDTKPKVSKKHRKHHHSRAVQPVTIKKKDDDEDEDV
jgi:hypothetical protein